MRSRSFRVEWPTWLLLFGCYSLWMLLTSGFAALGPWLCLPLVIPLVTLHSSLQHEALHGHPTRSRNWNEAVVYPPLGLAFPYRRFRDTHLQHHRNEQLTDPYDDPESFYLAEGDWRSLPAPVRLLLEANATLLGRLVIGPALGVAGFWRSDFRRIAAGDREIAIAWGHHLLGAAMVFAWTWGVCGIHPLVYLFGVAYPAYSLLLIRTFAEHQAERAVPERTAIIESSGPMALLFLNNNLHAAHHERPSIAWYRLPAYWRAHRERILDENGGVAYHGYREVFARFLLRRRDQIPHPFLRRENMPRTE